MSEIAHALIVTGYILSVVLTLAALLTWMERKQSALMQDRIGANRASILGFRAIGLFHIIADSLKMFLKEDFVPARGVRLFHTLAPFISAFCALAIFACIPFGPSVPLGDTTVNLWIFDSNISLLYVLALGSLGIYGIFFAGWSSHNKFAYLGAMRGAAQMLSYEIALGISLIGLIMIYGSLSLNDIIHYQGQQLFGFLPAWGVVLQPLACLIFLTAGIAESKRNPFDMPEGESEIIGYFTEYSSMKFGLFFLADFIEVVVVAALVTVLFFGGWQVPYLLADGFHLPGGTHWGLTPLAVGLIQVGAFCVKLFFFCWLQLTIRWTLPRFRYDQLMRLGWQFLLPLSIANILVTGIILVCR